MDRVLPSTFSAPRVASCWREKKIFARVGRARSSACIAVIYFKLMTERRTKFLSALRNAVSFGCLCRVFIVLSWSISKIGAWIRIFHFNCFARSVSLRSLQMSRVTNYKCVLGNYRATIVLTGFWNFCTLISHWRSINIHTRFILHICMYVCEIRLIRIRKCKILL